MTKEQELYNLMAKANYQLTRRGKLTNRCSLELFNALKAKIEKHGL
jgi:uncharacterized protein YjhX (UPF0386 family)